MSTAAYTLLLFGPAFSTVTSTAACFAADAEAVPVVEKRY